MKKVYYGAKKGGRVHWLLWHLTTEFKGKYACYYDYDRHNYLFYRRSGYVKIHDLFVIVQTSKHYWRGIYVNTKKGIFETFGYKNTCIIAEIMLDLYKETKEYE